MIYTRLLIFCQCTLCILTILSQVRWLFNDKPVSGKSFLVSVSGSRQVLCIPEMNSETTGVIACVVENEVGKATCRASLRLADSKLASSISHIVCVYLTVFYKLIFFVVVRFFMMVGSSNLQLINKNTHRMQSRRIV